VLEDDDDDDFLARFVVALVFFRRCRFRVLVGALLLLDL